MLLIYSLPSSIIYLSHISTKLKTNLFQRSLTDIFLISHYAHYSQSITYYQLFLSIFLFQGIKGSIRRVFCFFQGIQGKLMFPKEFQ